MGSQTRIAVIGDIHGCIDELVELYAKLRLLSLCGIYHAGDLVDRGPDSGAVIDFCRENGIQGVLGNHEESILGWWRRYKEEGIVPNNKDKARTLSQLNDERVAYMQSLPKLHVFDQFKTVLVHGGLWPGRGLHQQPHNIIRAQMIHQDEDKLGRTRWWGKDAPNGASKKTEAESYLEGWRRWYEIYDWDYNVVFGHSVFKDPFVHESVAGAKCVGVDQGGCFGGFLTAVILPDMQFVQVRAHRTYTGRVFE